MAVLDTGGPVLTWGETELVLKENTALMKGEKQREVALMKSGGGGSQEQVERKFKVNSQSR